MDVKTKRNSSFDLLRILAIWCVLFSHSKAFFLHTELAGQPSYWPALMFEILTKISVPLFFMISGALLLQKEEPIRVVLKKRVLRFAVILFLFSFIQYLYYISFFQRPFSLSEFFTRLYTEDWSVSYWYLYAYIAFLLVLPFLRYLVSRMKDRDFLYLFLLYGIFTAFLPLVEFPLLHGQTLNPHVELSLEVAQNVFYPLLGYFLEHRLKTAPLKAGLLLIPLSVLAIFIMAKADTYRCLYLNNWEPLNAEYYHMTLIFIPAACVFLLVKAYFLRFPLKTERAVRLLAAMGGSVFGIMLTGNIVMDLLKVPVYYPIRDAAGVFAGSVVLVTLTVVLTGAAVMLVRLIPGVKKWI